MPRNDANRVNADRSTITLTIEQYGELTRATWETDDIEDATGMLDAVLDHIADAMPKDVQRFACYAAYADLAEGAGLYE